jgi:hypothetical protein
MNQLPVVQECLWNWQVGKVGGYYHPNTIGKIQKYNRRPFHIKLASGALNLSGKLIGISNIIMKSQDNAYIFLLQWQLKLYSTNINLRF